MEESTSRKEVKNMDKSFIEERLKQKAKNRVSVKKGEADNAVSKNIILNKLKIKIGEKEYFMYELLSMGNPVSIEHTNLSDITKELQNDYYQEESDYLINSLDNIQKYLESAANSKDEYAEY